jgi:hypothetical protein
MVPLLFRVTVCHTLSVVPLLGTKPSFKIMSPGCAMGHSLSDCKDAFVCGTQTARLDLNINLRSLLERVVGGTVTRLPTVLPSVIISLLRQTYLLPFKGKKLTCFVGCLGVLILLQGAGWFGSYCFLVCCHTISLIRDQTPEIGNSKIKLTKILIFLIKKQPGCASTGTKNMSVFYGKHTQ